MKEKCTKCGKEREVAIYSHLQKMADESLSKLRPSELKVLELRHPGTLCTDGLVHVWKRA